MDSPTRHLGAHSAPRDVRPSSPTSEHLDSDTEDQDPPRHARIAPARVIANSPRPHTTNARSFYHSYRHGGDTDDVLPPASRHSSSMVRDQTAQLANMALNDSITASTIRRLSVGSTQRPISGYGDNFSRNSALAGNQHQYLEVPQTPPRESHLTSMFKRNPPSPAVHSPGWKSVRSVRTARPDDEDARGHEGEREPLFKPGDNSRPNYDTISTSDHEDLEDQSDDFTSHNTAKRIGHGLLSHFHGHKLWTKEEIWHEGVLGTAAVLPAVFLGLLLNVLDGLSYGMILFPLGQDIFQDFGPDGLSMFYVSCIVSQLVYSCGGSAFKGGVGSEMIEVVPFFHKMAFTIMSQVGEDNPRAVVATTITSYAISSIITGAVFFALGSARLGSLIGFFPRHILVGCIGGVGWFLMATGIEVSAKLDGNLQYDLDTLRELTEPHTLALWTVPLACAVLLIILQKFIKSSLFMPLYFMFIPIFFYIVVVGIAGIDLPFLRQGGWVFDAPAAGVPFYHFYTLYDFRVVDWNAILNTVPAMFALTFFGILHVPINVPALGVSTGEDNIDVDRELIAHGISNALSGFAGSIQNYLVYSNSILFVRAGGNSRLAGVLLAIGTAGVMAAGPTVIGFIPIMVVGALIFLLGIELMKEALFDTFGKLSRFEYITICIIVIAMGAWDFVYGILIGVVLACVSLVVQTSRKSAIRATYTGITARSTVRRHQVQQRFLSDVGQQIFVVRLSSYMFFGTIGSLERYVRELLDDTNFTRQPIRFLILDLLHVTGMDFSAAEAFTRMKRLLSARKVEMVLANVNARSDVGQAMSAVGLLDDEEIAVFDDLNAALESCENDLLRVLYLHADESSETESVGSQDYLPMPKPPSSKTTITDLLQGSGSPRRTLLQRAATNTLQSSEVHATKWKSFKQPLPLLLQTFQGMTDKNEDYWYRVTPYFHRRFFPQGSEIYHSGDRAEEFYLVEDGILRIEYPDQNKYTESIMAGTTCGELPFFADIPRTGTVIAEKDTVAWVLDRKGWEELQEKFPDGARELLRLSLKLTSERIDAITKYMCVGT